MTFRTADALLQRQMAGHTLPAAARPLGLRLLCFARGVAVYELPRGGRLSAGVLGALAEAATTAAATTTVADGRDLTPSLREWRGRFHRDAAGTAGGAVRAEAVVTRVDPDGSVRVEAEVHCDGDRIATFEAGYTPVSRAIAAAPEAGLMEEPRQPMPV